MVKDKKEVAEEKIIEDAPKNICLNLGCGFRKMGDPDNYWINIDNRSECEPNMLLDITKPFPFEDNSISEVRAFDVLEHIPIGETVQVIEEIYRVLKPGGKFEHFTPLAPFSGAFQDPFHRSFWVKNSWLYFTDPDHRNLYNIQANFKIIKLEELVTNKQMNIVHLYGIMEKI